ncbi:MAG TPA: 5-formyltetrahydrofolate cyclo-ligase [Bacteroidales bacterium]|nr:5-formyltetrahydrofolate cyclo-ligase [Bacteroidales bacterium]
MALYSLLCNIFFRSQKRRKDKLRAVLAQKRRILVQDEVAVCSEEVVRQILSLPDYQYATTVMIYYPVHNEINLLGLTSLSPEKTFLLPVAHKHSLEIRRYQGEDCLIRGKYGIPVPTAPSFTGEIDLIIVPGVAFDAAGNRMGRGGGYYDRFLRHYSRTPKIGVGYRFQFIEQLPHDRFDTPLNQIILAQSK